MVTRNRIGNDIVDLSHPYAREKVRDERFIRRVFRDSERRLIDAAETPFVLLWTIWAAKESAYKAVKKIEPATVFAHRQFEVIPADPACSHGVVRFLNRLLRVWWSFGQDYVHCVCETRPAAGHVFTALCEIPQRANESHVVRNLARRIIEIAGYGNAAEVVRPTVGGRPGPPQIVVCGRWVEELDLSMSHDERFAAAVLARLSSSSPSGLRSASTLWYTATALSNSHLTWHFVQGLPS